MTTTTTAIKPTVLAAAEKLAAMKAGPKAPEWLKNFNPLSGHTPETRVPGSSFFQNDLTVEDILGLLDLDFEVKEQAGHKGARCFVFHTGIFASVEADPVPRVVLRKIHGCLQGALVYNYVTTDAITIVITPEEDGQFALASIFPGLPDPDPDFEGLEEGALMSVEEAERRGIRVKIPGATMESCHFGTD